MTQIDEYPRLVKTFGGRTGFAACIEHFSSFNGHEWLFRGVCDESLDLKPKVGRPRIKTTKRPQTLAYSAKHERAVVQLFKQNAMAYLPSLHRTELEWMALAQHFGVPTRMLDWSDSLIVAAWFAIQDPPSGKTCDGAIWVTRDMASVPDPATFDPLSSFTEPLIYRPPHIAPRIGAQGSVLMVCPVPERSTELDLLRWAKILIPHKARFHLRKRLDALGVNAQSTYSDLAGLGEHLAWRYRNGYVAGGLDRDDD